jgi:hypothetical protein
MMMPALPCLRFAAWALALALACAAAPVRAAAPGSFRGEYTVSYLGLSLARAAFSSRYADGVYSIDGSVSSAGLATIFDDTRGTLKATGTIKSDRLVPALFRADYLSGKKASLVDIRFANGMVTSTRVLPPPKKRGRDWFPLRVGDLAGVADPIAATAIPAPSLDRVCGRTIRMYDGEMRANLVLGPAEKGTISVGGYEGPTVTCRMRFQPVAGYRKGRKALEFLRTKSRIMVTFAPLGQTGVYAPIHATVGTQIGTITIHARRFEATN